MTKKGEELLAGQANIMRQAEEVASIQPENEEQSTLLEEYKAALDRAERINWIRMFW